MKQLTLALFVLISFASVAQAHNGIEHGAEHITFFHIAHYLLLFGGIVAASIVAYRERKELFKRQ